MGVQCLGRAIRLHFVHGLRLLELLIGLGRSISYIGSFWTVSFRSKLSASTWEMTPLTLRSWLVVPSPLEWQCWGARVDTRCISIVGGGAATTRKFPISFMAESSRVSGHNGKFNFTPAPDCEVRGVQVISSPIQPSKVGPAASLAGQAVRHCTQTVRDADGCEGWCSWGRSDLAARERLLLAGSIVVRVVGGVRRWTWAHIKLSEQEREDDGAVSFRWTWRSRVCSCMEFLKQLEGCASEF